MNIRRVVPNIVSDKPDACRDFYVGLLGFQDSSDRARRVRTSADSKSA